MNRDKKTGIPAGRAWLDGTEVTIPQARETVRHEAVRADRMVIIFTDGVRMPCSLTLRGPIVRAVFGLDDMTTLEPEPSGVVSDPTSDPSFDASLGACAQNCNLGWEGPAPDGTLKGGTNTGGGR